jgi:hypothetical protein
MAVRHDVQQYVYMYLYIRTFTYMYTYIHDIYTFAVTTYTYVHIHFCSNKFESSALIRQHGMPGVLIHCMYYAAEDLNIVGAGCGRQIYVLHVEVQAAF